MVPSEATAMPRPLLAAAVGFGAMNCCITAPVVALNSSSVTLPKVALLPHTPVSAHTATDVIKATAAQIKKRFLISLVVLQSKRLGMARVRTSQQCPFARQLSAADLG